MDFLYSYNEVAIGRGGMGLRSEWSYLSWKLGMIFSKPAEWNWVNDVEGNTPMIKHWNMLLNA